MRGRGKLLLTDLASDDFDGFFVGQHVPDAVAAQHHEAIPGLQRTLHTHRERETMRSGWSTSGMPHGVCLLWVLTE